MGRRPIFLYDRGVIRIREVEMQASTHRTESAVYLVETFGDLSLHVM